MPLIVDKEKVKQEILTAFEECVKDKPIFNISLRDIAKKANMTHPKLLNYFPTKEDIILAYCNRVEQYMTRSCEKWFAEHDHNDYPSPLAYLNAFMEYVANVDMEGDRPRAGIQIYVLAQYNQDVRKSVAREFQTWRATMERCLKEVYGDSVGPAEAEALMVLISRTLICRYNEALTGAINDNMISQFFNLS